MGRSLTCKFQVNVNLSDGRQSVYGAQSFKEARAKMESEAAYLKECIGTQPTVLNCECWPQTEAGRKQIQKDYALIDRNGKVTHHFISQK